MKSLVFRNGGRIDFVETPEGVVLRGSGIDYTVCDSDGMAFGALPDGSVLGTDKVTAGILERVGHLEYRMETVDGFHIVGEEPAFYKRLNAIENEMAMIRAAVGSVQDPLNPMPLVDLVLSLNRRLESIRPDLERLSALEAQVKDMDEALGDLRRLSPVTVGSAVMLHDKQISGLKERVEAIMRSVESMQPKTATQVMLDYSGAERVDRRQRKFREHLTKAKAAFGGGKTSLLAVQEIIKALELFSAPAAPEITQGEQPPRPGKIRFAKYPDPACWKRIQEADDLAAAEGLPRVAPELTAQESFMAASRCGKTNAILADEMHKMGVPEDTIQRMLEGETQTGPKSVPLPLTTKPLIDGEIPTQEAVSKPVQGVSPEMAKEFDRLFKLGLEATKAILAGENPLDPWRHRSSEMRCKTCMWFTPKYVESNTLNDPTRPMATTLTKGPVGRCRRRAPTMSGYPVVYESDWCGDHKIDEAKA